MKHWWGYLVAAIVCAFTYMIEKFAQAHSALVDIFYPYVSRMAQTFLAEWSSGVSFCLWQALLIAFLVVVLFTAVLLVILKGNPVRWVGWVLAAASVLVLLNTGIYGLNQYAGPISEDVHLEEQDYTVDDLRKAAEYYRDQANALASQVARQDGQVKLPSLETLNRQAVYGFDYMKNEQYQSIFAGSTLPVKRLGWEGYYTVRGVDGVVMGLTGEAAVNPRTPTAAMPFAICRLMAQRMCIANMADANMAAFYTCRSNPEYYFQYAAYLAAYDHCTQVLGQLQGGNLLTQVQQGASSQLTADVKTLHAFYNVPDREQTARFCDYLVSLYIQEQVLPQQQEEERKFDPLDETQVDLTGIVNAGG